MKSVIGTNMALFIHPFLSFHFTITPNEAGLGATASLVTTEHGRLTLASVMCSFSLS